MDSWEEAVSDVMYAGGMQCEATMLKSKLLLVLEAEMESMQNFRWFTLLVICNTLDRVGFYRKSL